MVDWLLVTGDWWLVTGNWWLVTGDWWLVIGKVFYCSFISGKTSKTNTISISINHINSISVSTIFKITFRLLLLFIALISVFAPNIRTGPIIHTWMHFTEVIKATFIISNIFCGQRGKQMKVLLKSGNKLQHSQLILWSPGAGRSHVRLIMCSQILSKLFLIQENQRRMALYKHKWEQSITIQPLSRKWIF